MATSETHICNLALSRIGQNFITTLTEGTRNSDVCNLHYASTRDALLRAHPWNFAIRRSALALDATAPNHEFDYRFALPTDPYCLKVIRTDWEATGFSGTAIYGFPGQMGYADYGVPYRIEGRFLLCNETTVSIEYIARIEDVAQFDDLFTDLLAQRLAAEMCVQITDNQSMAKGLWEIYGAKLSEARTMDAQEGTPRAVVDASPWLVARF